MPTALSARPLRRVFGLRVLRVLRVLARDFAFVMLPRLVFFLAERFALDFLAFAMVIPPKEVARYVMIIAPLNGPTHFQDSKVKLDAATRYSVRSIVDCFTGQPLVATPKYAIDPGLLPAKAAQPLLDAEELEGFRNADLRLTMAQLLANIGRIQAEQDIPQARCR